MNTDVKTVKTKSFSTEYFCFGNGDKTMVILPGLSVQSVMNAADAIADGYGIMKDEFTVYVFDRKKELSDRYTLNDMADDTAAVFDELKLKDIYLFGASQGGMLALCIAANRPDIIKKVAVASAAISLSKDRYNVIGEWIDMARQDNAAGLYDCFAKSVYPPQAYIEYKELIESAAKTVTKEELRRFAILAGAVKDLDLRFCADKIRCPLFAVGAADDKVLGKNAIKEIITAFGALPGFVYKTYEGYGHALYDLAPDFKQSLYGFFVDKTAQ